jgi:serine/threonine-protein kinase
VEAVRGQAKDISFGQVALREGLVTPAQLEECLEIQRKLKSLGVTPRKLGEIMVEKGYLSRGQVEGVLRLQRRLEERRQIAGYEIVSLIGKGGMGAVYKAKQLSLERVVALKILPPRYARDRSFIKRFVAEARTVARLNHENIIAGIDVGESNGYYYFAMEYVDGETVAAGIERDGPFEEKRALRIVAQIARALNHAQKNGLVHRDVKPQNIMLARNDVAKLCDLGLARSEEGEASSSRGLSLGTPHYISPEQAKGEPDVDIRSDIYSLGATLYHMVTGETPFTGSSPMVLMTKHLTEVPVSPRRKAPRLSRGCNDLILKMMAKRKEARYQDPIELLEDIEKVLEGQPLGFTMKSSPKLRRLPKGKEDVPRGLGRYVDAEAEKKRKFSRVRRLRKIQAKRRLENAVLAGAICILFVVIGLVAYLYIRSTEPPPPPPPPQATKEEERLAGRAMEEAAAFAGRHPLRTAEIIARYEEVVRRYPNTSWAKHARREIERLRRRR